MLVCVESTLKIVFFKTNSTKRILWDHDENLACLPYIFALQSILHAAANSA
jgi:hypothetical protein